MGAFHLVKISGISRWVVNGNRFVGSSHWKIPRKSGKSKKSGPVFPVGISERNVVFHLPFSKFVPVPGPRSGIATYRCLRPNGTTFYQSEIPLLLPPKFPSFFPKWKAPNISSHFCLVAFSFEPVCSVGLRWLLFTWVLKIPYRVKFSPLYQSCPFLTSNLVFQDQRKDKRKHIQCRSIVSSENECRR